MMIKPLEELVEKYFGQRHNETNAMYYAEAIEALAKNWPNSGCNHARDLLEKICKHFDDRLECPFCRARRIAASKKNCPHCGKEVG